MPVTIAEAVHKATEQLLPASESAKLDAEVLLAHVLQKTRTYLHTWPEQPLTETQAAAYLQLVHQRAKGTPVAYLIGEQEFWSLSLHVSPATLIPRPETELLVEQALRLIPRDSRARILDLGTGSGAIALAIASERRACEVTAVDKSLPALEMARHNAERLGIKNVRFIVSDWFAGLSGRQFDVIVANPPYVCDRDPHLLQGDVRFEPASALRAGADGLDDLRYLIGEAGNYLVHNGWLLLEHGYDQAAAVQTLLRNAGFREVLDLKDYAGQPRLAIARL